MGKNIWLSIQARKFGYDVTLRPLVRTLRVWVSRNESLSSPLESFVSKGFRNDWQIRICQLSKCLVDFRGQLFDFWGVHGWFQKKYPADWLREEKSMQRNSSEKQYPALKWYYSWRIMLKKKSYTVPPPEVWEKIITSKSPIHPSPLNVQWSC